MKIDLAVKSYPHYPKIIMHAIKNTPVKTIKSPQQDEK